MVLLPFQPSTITDFGTFPDVRRRVREIHSPKRSYDDLIIIRLKLNTDREQVQLSHSPRVSYLNLVDYQNKIGDFHSSVFSYSSMHQFRNDYRVRGKSQEWTEILSCASVFYFYVMYMEDMSTTFEDISTMCRKFQSVVKCLRHCDILALGFSFNAILNYYRHVTPRRGGALLAMMKHLCFLQEMKICATENLLLNCCMECRFLGDLLDLAIENRFNFWTMWERNFNFSTIPFCPVTFAYFSGRIELVRILLNYGFRQTHHRIRTVKRILDDEVSCRCVDIPWLKKLIPKEDQSPRSAVITEVAIFIGRLHFEHGIRVGYLNSFELVWNARKEPCVTRAELMNALIEVETIDNLTMAAVRNRNRFLEILACVQSIVKDYEWEVLKPRSLTHLCKCTIREALNDNWQMPRGVAKLPLPDKMKSYILLEKNAISLADYSDETWMFKKLPAMR